MICVALLVSVALTVVAWTGHLGRWLRVRDSALGSIAGLVGYVVLALVFLWCLGRG